MGTLHYFRERAGDLGVGIIDTMDGEEFVFWDPGPSHATVARNTEHPAPDSSIIEQVSSEKK